MLPKSAAVAREGAIDARLTATISADRRFERAWRADATSSFPVPVSPRANIGTSRSATLSISCRTCSIAWLQPTMEQDDDAVCDLENDAARTLICHQASRLAEDVTVDDHAGRSRAAATSIPPSPVAERRIGERLR